MTTDTEVPFVVLPAGTFIDTSHLVAVSGEQAKTEKVDCFRRLWKETGLTLPELAAALERPLGTLTKYTHNGASSLPPPDRVLEAMDRLVRERVRELAAARGYSLVKRTPKPPDRGAGHQPSVLPSRRSGRLRGDDNSASGKGARP